MKDELPETFYPKTRNDWRDWLCQHHATKESVWLIFDKKVANPDRIKWSDAVEEALCFGWIDSRSKPIDHEKYLQFFGKRKAKSTWSKINKDKVQFLAAQGLMEPAGLKSIEVAKQNGSWNILDSVEALELPEDLLNVFEQEPALRTRFDALSKSVRKQILLSLVLARKAETRYKRIGEIVQRLGDLQE